MDTRSSIINHLQMASRAMMEAYKEATTYHPMAAEVPTFMRMQALIKEVNGLMLEVNKLKGFK